MSIVYFIVSILFLILIHEWGHFYAARLRGVGVKTFSIGFGKPIFGFTDTNTGTHWQLAWIPLGGYVRLKGETQASESADQADCKGGSFESISLLSKLFILLAGPAMNLLFAALVYVLVVLNAPGMPATVIAQPVEGTAAAQAGMQVNDQIMSVNGAVTDNWVQLEEALNQKTATYAISVLRKDSNLQDNTVVITLSPKLSQSTNLDAISVKERTLDLGLQPKLKGLLIQRLITGGAAENAGLKPEDVVVNIDQRTLDSPLVLQQILANYRPEQAPLALEVNRAGQTLLLNVSPIKDAQNAYKLGIQFSPHYAYTSTKRVGLEAVTLGVKMAWQGITLTLQAFFDFLQSPFSSDQLGGPVMIAQVASGAAAQGGWAALLFLAGLSISLGVLNLLPIPMLDGGQMVYHLIRSINLHVFAKLVGDNQQTSTNNRYKTIFKAGADRLWYAVGAGFIAFLTIIAFYNDIKRLL